MHSSRGGSIPQERGRLTANNIYTVWLEIEESDSAETSVESDGKRIELAAFHTRETAGDRGLTQDAVVEPRRRSAKEGA